jgi:hypothetical protein
MCKLRLDPNEDRPVHMGVCGSGMINVHRLRESDFARMNRLEPAVACG